MLQLILSQPFFPARQAVVIHETDTNGYSYAEVRISSLFCFFFP